MNRKDWEGICEEATIDDFGRLEAKIVIENPESGEQETYKVNEFRNLDSLYSKTGLFIVGYRIND